jgi:hypothetical protein
MQSIEQGRGAASHLHAVNERIRELSQTFSSGAHAADFVCECGCSQFVRLSFERYDALRGAPVYVGGHPNSRST